MLLKSRVCKLASALILALLICAGSAAASTREVRVPLKDGKLHVADFSAAVCRTMSLPGLPLGSGDIDLGTSKGTLFLQAVNLSLGETGHVHVQDSAVVLRVDSDRLESRCQNLSRAVRVLAAEANPQAMELQATRWGLFLPDKLDDSRPLVVLIHGIDSDAGMLQPMADLLAASGYQAARFCFPGDQPIDDSAAMLAARLAELRTHHPKLKIEIVAHSMGGLVARRYIEGAEYAGGVDRLIMIGTPNGGSGWARLRFLLSLQQHYHLWRTDPRWSATWWFTEGFGEAGRDLSPGSDFLNKMATLPRRDGVQYTIIAGTQHSASRLSAECFDGMSGWFSGRGATWWGLRQCKSGLDRAANSFRTTTGDGDGPVSVASAKLKGVDDVVLLPADHIALFVPVDGKPPAAWATIQSRLVR
jgi:pimeloyl-ACP methyl ester carboxylesterase